MFKFTSLQVCKLETYEGCDLVPLITSSIGDSELIIHFQEARLFPNCKALSILL